MKKHELERIIIEKYKNHPLRDWIAQKIRNWSIIFSANRGLIHVPIAVGCVLAVAFFALLAGYGRTKCDCPCEKSQVQMQVMEDANRIDLAAPEDGE